MPLPNFLSSLFPTASNPTTGTLYTTPWAWRTDDGIYVGHNRQVWLYRVLEVAPVEWEDDDRKLDLGGRLHQLLAELGSTSTAPAGGLRQLSNNRELHLVAITWDQIPPVPDTTPEQQAYLSSLFTFSVPDKAVFVGVKLRAAGPQLPAQPGLKGFMDFAAGSFTRVMGERVPNLDPYAADRKRIEGIMGRANAKAPTRDQSRHLEAWYNHGGTTDATIHEHRTHLDVVGRGSIEMSSVIRFGQTTMTAPDAAWIAEAAAHPDAPFVVSVRAELEPFEMTRARARRSQRKVIAQMEEEAATGDIERSEYADTFHLAREFEQHTQHSREALLSNVSIVMARTSEPVDETYMDALKSAFDIEMKPLEHRQLLAIEETLPTSNRRANPFVQDLSISMLAYAGVTSHSELGDRTGAMLGLVDPLYTPLMLDPAGAPKANQPASMLVTGDSGSGKTFFAQLLAAQAHYMGYPVVFINPKASSSLKGMLTLAGEKGRHVAMSTLSSTRGALDPFRYTTPEQAAEIATAHILSVLREFSESQQLTLETGLKRGALAGAQCVGECLDYVTDEDVVSLVRQQCENSLFALAISDTPVSKAKFGNELTLIEFDRYMNLPTPGTKVSEYTREMRISVAAYRLVVRASLYMLYNDPKNPDPNHRGGVLMIDEAHNFLGSSEAYADLDKLAREGRSQNILPVFITQAVTDLTDGDHDLGQHLSRVFCFQTRDNKEAAAALTLCGLEPTEARIGWLRDCGPRRQENGTDRPAWALHRDLKNRHAAVAIAPIPDYIKQAITTNPDDIRDQRTSEAFGDPTQEP